MRERGVHHNVADPEQHAIMVGSRTGTDVLFRPARPTVIRIRAVGAAQVAETHRANVQRLAVFLVRAQQRALKPVLLQRGGIVLVGLLGIGDLPRGVGRFPSGKRIRQQRARHRNRDRLGSRRGRTRGRLRPRDRRKRQTRRTNQNCNAANQDQPLLASGSWFKASGRTAGQAASSSRLQLSLLGCRPSLLLDTAARRKVRRPMDRLAKPAAASAAESSVAL